MVSFPSCKINLGLHIIAKRSDGYHGIETAFYPVFWTDILEIIPSTSFSFQSTGYEIPGKEEENICIKAYQLLKRDFSIGPVQIHLHKIIPIGAGLGGGSSDGAHTLRLVNTIFGLDLSVEQLRNYAGQLGSDCPFFIEETPMLGTGRGEVLTRVSLSLKGKYLLIVKPNIHVSTAEAYANVRPKHPDLPLAEILSMPIENWKTHLYNDFESTLFNKYPEIEKIKHELYSMGAVYASMSGSGSAVYGIFNSSVSIPDVFKKFICWSGKLT